MALGRVFFKVTWSIRGVREATKSSLGMRKGGGPEGGLEGGGREDEEVETGGLGGGGGSAETSRAPRHSKRL